MIPKLIESIDELRENLEMVESYINSDASEEDAAIMSGYIQRGHNLVAYKVGRKYHFAPSRFVGYKHNDIKNHEYNRKHQRVSGTETDNRISRSDIIGAKHVQSDELEKEYQKFCAWLGVAVHKGRIREYWSIDKDIVTSTGIQTFDEGDVKVRQHKVRERNQKVVALAKQRFKEKHGRLYCEACGFDFEKVYGKQGKGYIEAHHIVPISAKKGINKISPDDFVMLCSNCHAMIHRPVNGSMVSWSDFKKKRK